MRVSLVYYDGDGRPTRLVGVHIDITSESGQRTSKADWLPSWIIASDVLATVQAVAAQTLQARPLDGALRSWLDGRVRSMASTHELLSHRRWLGIPLVELVERELAPYATGSNTEFSGPEVMLSAEAGQTIGMVLHELVTNAAKHGALSVSSGGRSLAFTPQMGARVAGWFSLGGRPADPWSLLRANLATAWTWFEASSLMNSAGRLTMCWLPRGSDAKLKFLSLI